MLASIEELNAYAQVNCYGNQYTTEALITQANATTNALEITQRCAGEIIASVCTEQNAWMAPTVWMAPVAGLVFVKTMKPATKGRVNALDSASLDLHPSPREAHVSNAVRASTGPIVTFPATATPFVTRCPATARVRAMPDGPRCFLGGPVQKSVTMGNMG